MSNVSKKGKYRSPDGSPIWEYISTFCCGLVIFSIGYVTGWNSPTIPILLGPDSPIPLTPTDASTLAASVALGHLVAPILSGLADKFGRKVGLIVTCIPMLISFGLIAVAKSVIVLLIARFSGGLALGFGICFIPMYLGEIASAKLRGRLVLITGTMMQIGNLFVFLVGPSLSIKMTAYIALSVITISLIGISIIPESPYFLTMIGKVEEAEGVLEKLRGRNDVTEELDLIKKTIREKDQITESNTKEGDPETPKRKINVFKQLFLVAGNRKALIVNLMLIVVLQFGGFTTIMVYGQVIFDAMKTKVPGHICMVIMATVQTIGNLLSVVVIDKFERRTLILTTSMIGSLGLLVTGVYFHLLEHTNIDVTPYGIIPLCGIFSTMIVFNTGLVPLQMIIQSETLGPEVKALVTTILGIGGGILATVGIKSYLLIAVVWGFGHGVPFIGFVIITIVSVVIILSMLPETRGKTLYEIQKDFGA